jgi:tight adherence protein B
MPDMISVFWALLPWLASMLAFAGLCAVVSNMVLRDSSRINQRVSEVFRKRQRERAGAASLFKNIGQRPAEELALEPADTAARDPAEADLWQRLESMVRQSGLDISPKRLLAMALTAGFVLAAVGAVLRHPWIGITSAPVGVVAPLIYVQMKRLTRMKKLLEQLPDAFDLMSRVLRAGHSIPQSLSAVADEFEPPIAAEFAYCCEQQNLGLFHEVTLRDMAQRTGLLEIKIFVMALLVQRETGGNLADLLERMAGFVRNRLRIQSTIRTLTAEARMQATVLLVLPPLMFAVLFVIKRDYAELLLTQPKMLVATIISMAVGALWIKKIVTIDT